MKFTIRDLLWLTVMVALVLGWWIDHALQKAWIAKHYEAAKRVGQIFILVDGKLILSQPPNERTNFLPTKYP